MMSTAHPRSDVGLTVVSWPPRMHRLVMTYRKPSCQLQPSASASKAPKMSAAMHRMLGTTAKTKMMNTKSTRHQLSTGFSSSFAGAAAGAASGGGRNMTPLARRCTAMRAAALARCCACSSGVSSARPSGAFQCFIMATASALLRKPE